MREPFDWRSRSSSDFTCVRCLEVKEATELDRLLWCDDCVARARARANRLGWIGGGVIALLVGLYISLVIRPDLSLIPQAWVAVVAVAIYLGYRLSRELFFGVERIKNRQAVEATPPEEAGD